MYTLYMHITPSNKRYIGITSNKTNTRWKRGNGYISNTHFYNAIQRYGWNNIQHIVIDTNLSEEEAKKQEIYLIAKYETQNPSKGYNKTEGGNTAIPLIGELNGMYGATHTREAREKISQAALHRFADKRNHPMYGKPRSKETRLKLSESHKGLNAGTKNYFYGKNKSGKDSWRHGTKHTDESKRKMSESRKGKYTGADAYNSKPIKCIETGEVFSCAAEVKQKHGYDNSTIGKCCKGKIKSAYDLHWEYIEIINSFV